MAEPVKIKFDYQNPENIEAEVPGSQKLREVQTDETLSKGDNVSETSITNDEISKESSETKENVTKGDDVVTKEDGVETRQRRRTNSGKRNGIHGEPVLFAEKPDDKKSKTKIPISRFRQTVEKINKVRRLSKEKSEHESHIPVRRSSIPKPIKDHKVPQTTTKQEITVTKSSTKISAIEHKITKTANTTETSDTSVKKETDEAEDEFDKLYAEVINDTPTDVILDDSLLNPKVEDPEKLESKFEEIIHDYEEHKIEPIDGVVVRKSKLPQLKRKSQQEIELSAQAERTSKIIAARDKLRLRHSLNKDEEFEKALDEELNKAFTEIPSNENEVNINHSEDKNDPQVDIKTESKHEIISSPSSKTEKFSQFTKIVSNSLPTQIENTESFSVIENSTLKEVINKTIKDTQKIEKQLITEENVTKDSIKIGIPVIESYTHEFAETIETEKSHEIKKVLSYKSDNQDLPVANTVSETKAETNTTEINKKEKTNISTLKSEFKVSESTNNLKTEIHNSSLDHISISEIERPKSKHLDMNESDNMADTREKNETKDISKTKEFEIEGEVQIRGKVEKLLSKIDSKEVKLSENTYNMDTEINNSSYDYPSKMTIEKAKSEHLEISKSSNITYTRNKKDTTETSTTKETEIEEEVQLRRKEEKLVSKIDSKEVIETEGNERESINELRKKKAVLSKIALFERKPEEIQNKVPKKGIRPPKLITKDWQKVETTHVHTPLIVEEVFKTFQTNTYLNHKENISETSLKDVTEVTNISTDSTLVSKSDSISYVTENKFDVKNKAIQENPVKINPQLTNLFPSIPNSQYLQQSDEIQVSKLLKESKVEEPPTASIKFEEFDTEQNENKEIESSTAKIKLDNYFFERTTNKNKEPPISNNKLAFGFKQTANKDTCPTKLNIAKELQSPVVIPGFKPVRTLLKSFESNHDTEVSHIKRSVSKDQSINIYTSNSSKIHVSRENKETTTQNSHDSENYDDFEIVNDYKSLDDVFSKETEDGKNKQRKNDELKRAKSLAELDIGDAVKGKVNNMILRIKSVDRTENYKSETINKKELPRKLSVSEKIALFEGKIAPSKSEPPMPLRNCKLNKLTERTQKIETPSINQRYDAKITEVLKQNNVIDVTKDVKEELVNDSLKEEDFKKKIEELANAKIKYGTVDNMAGIELSNGIVMPLLAVGTALLDPRLCYHIVSAAIDLGYRAIDAAYIYGNEKQVGEAIRDKIADGTVKREDLFIISKLWSTFHRTDLVEDACKASLDTMGLDYFDLYLVHNPMSFKEGGAPIPKIATVLQYSEHDYLDAWYGMEQLVSKGLARAIGVSNFNSVQLQRVLDRGRVKPVVNQVECHPYLSQQRLDLFCSERKVTLSCFGVLGSKGTPLELRNGQPAVIDDALVQVMASGLEITPAQLLISYQLENGHAVVVKASSAHHLYDNLLAQRVRLTTGQVDALHALNRNKRMFAFKGMGDTHKNYPFNIAF